MTNYEHMTDEERKNALIYGLYKTMEGDVKPCPCFNCSNCNCSGTTCAELITGNEKKDWLNAEYEPPKTKNEMFCKTLKVGEIIAVWDTDEEAVNGCLYRVFKGYYKEHDAILTNGALKWRYGRKLTAAEKGE